MQGGAVMADMSFIDGRELSDEVLEQIAGGVSDEALDYIRTHWDSL